MELYSPKVALVTGGSRGIGRAIVQALVASGRDVGFTFLSRDADAREVEQTAGVSERKVRAFRADIAIPDDVEHLFREVEAEFGGVDIVVHAAGAPYVSGPIASLSVESFDQTFAIQARGTFLVLREAARRVRDGGAIVSLSSTVTLTRRPTAGLHAASKAAGEQLIFALAKELGERGISVNAVSPGATRTESLIAPPEMLEQVAKQTPLGRIAEPDDIARVVAFLVGPEGRWISGQNVQANGGLI